MTSNFQRAAVIQAIGRPVSIGRATIRVLEGIEENPTIFPKPFPGAAIFALVSSITPGPNNTMLIPLALELTGGYSSARTVVG